LFFRLFGHIFGSKKKLTKIGKEYINICLYSFSGILYEPFLLLDAPIDAHFAAFTAGASEEGEDVEEVAEFVIGRPVGHIHERADFWVEHLNPDPYVRGILDHGFKVVFTQPLLRAPFWMRLCVESELFHV
jgi:hypothetical protein